MALANYDVEKDGDIEKMKAKLEEKKGEINFLNKDIELLHLKMAKT